MIVITDTIEGMLIWKNAMASGRWCEGYAMYVWIKMFANFANLKVLMKCVILS